MKSNWFSHVNIISHIFLRSVVSSKLVPYKNVSTYKSSRQPSDWNPTSYRKQKSDSDSQVHTNTFQQIFPNKQCLQRIFPNPLEKNPALQVFNTWLLSSAANPHTLGKSHRQLLVAFGQLDWICFPTPKCTRHAPNKYMISTASEQNGQLLKHFHKKRLGDLCLFDLSFRYCCWFWRCSTVAAIKHLALSKLPDSQENFGCVDLNCFGSQQSIWFTRAKND